jgi:hypothetical protein
MNFSVLLLWGLFEKQNERKTLDNNHTTLQEPITGNRKKENCINCNVRRVAQVDHRSLLGHNAEKK